ncbi:MAG: hypothetical protein HW421_1066 [Ignavibacteria bacterium]|nr:hypothetical protein [Ignavibacteria bacterium]
MKNLNKKKIPDDFMKEEYNFDYSKGVRGKYHKQMSEGYTVTVYSPDKETYEKLLSEKATFIKIDNDVLEVFKTSHDVNNALREIIKAIPKTRKRVTYSD